MKTPLDSNGGAGEDYLPRSLQHELEEWEDAQEADLEQARQIAQGDDEDRTIDKPVLNSGECPTGCGRKVSYGKLLCGHCWSRVSYDLQRGVILTWRRHLKLMRGERTPAQVKVSRAEYKAAKEAAIASIT